MYYHQYEGDEGPIIFDFFTDIGRAKILSRTELRMGAVHGQALVLPEGKTRKTKYS